MEFPRLNAATFQRFLDDFTHTPAATLNILLHDNARSDKARDLPIPANVVVLSQEPYAPELNPYERVSQAFKDALVWNCFLDPDALRHHMVALVRDFDEAMLRSLTAYPYECN